MGAQDSIPVSGAPDALRHGGASAPHSVAVVIPVYNRAAYLRDALASVAAQSRPADEVIVVDDGSVDDPETVVAQFPGVRLLRQDNLGPSRARNAGLAAARADYVLFLDSDDVLLPDGIAACLACMAENPGAAVAYGAHLPVDQDLVATGGPRFIAMARDAYHDLLEGNGVLMLGSALFDRTALLAVGGFDDKLSLAEDYDLYLRLARNYPFACDPALVAKYRAHPGNLSARHAAMMESALAVQERHRPSESDGAGMRAYRKGQRALRMIVANSWSLAQAQDPTGETPGKLEAYRAAPFAAFIASLWQIVRKLLPARAIQFIKSRLSGYLPTLQKLDFGDLARRRPVGTAFGRDRGTSIDQFYIDKFFQRHAGAMRGRIEWLRPEPAPALPEGNFAYTFEAEPSGANRVREVAAKFEYEPASAPDGHDCIAWHHGAHDPLELERLIARSRVRLNPGGVLLATLPGVAGGVQTAGADGFWAPTPDGARRMFEREFGEGNVEVTSFGNVYAATSFLQGLAVEDIDAAWLDGVDPAFPLVLGIAARRPA
ncbi:glycosyltransferase family 2 protein [Tsuneonella sp. HG222]